MGIPSGTSHCTVDAFAQSERFCSYWAIAQNGSSKGNIVCQEIWTMCGVLTFFYTPGTKPVKESGRCRSSRRKSRNAYYTTRLFRASRAVPKCVDPSTLQCASVYTNCWESKCPPPFTLRLLHTCCRLSSFQLILHLSPLTSVILLTSRHLRNIAPHLTLLIPLAAFILHPISSINLAVPSLPPLLLTSVTSLDSLTFYNLTRLPLTPQSPPLVSVIRFLLSAAFFSLFLYVRIGPTILFRFAIIFAAFPHTYLY